MRVYLQSILFGRAQNYATRRGYADDKERAAIVDGWMAGYASGRRKDVRVDKLINEIPLSELEKFNPLRNNK